MATTDELNQRMDLSLTARRAIIRLTHNLKTEGEIPHAGAISAFIAGVHNDAAADSLFPDVTQRLITDRIEKLIAALQHFETFCDELEPVPDEVAQRTRSDLEAYFAEVARWYAQDALDTVTGSEPGALRLLANAALGLASNRFDAVGSDHLSGAIMRRLVTNLVNAMPDERERRAA
jgi:hypothetical protein